MRRWRKDLAVVSLLKLALANYIAHHPELIDAEAIAESLTTPRKVPSRLLYSRWPH